MKISVVVTVYNLEEYIPEALQSVFNQSRKADEIIVVDDCSTDATEDVLKSFGSKINYIRLEKNSGALINTLTGVKNSSGDILCMLDGDDVWAANKLETVEKYFADDENLILLSHQHERVDEKLILLHLKDETHENIERILKTTNDKFEQSRLFKETILEQRGYWLGSAYSFRRDCFDLKAFEKIINSYKNTRFTYLDLVIAPFLVLTNPEKVVAYTPHTFFKYRIHSSASMSSKNNVDSLFKSITRGKSTNELIYFVMKEIGVDEKYLQRRMLLIEHYDFLSALYNRNLKLAFRLFFKLSRRLWSKKVIVKEFKRVAYISIFGISAFLRALSK